MFVITELAHGFDLTLMRYLPELFCFEVKPNSIYGKTDYISLLVKASILNGYAEGTSNVSRKVGNAPTGDTILSYLKSIDRYELQMISLTKRFSPKILSIRTRRYAPACQSQ